MSSELEKIIGPRVPADEMKANRMRYIIPTLFFIAAAVLLIISIQRPWWRLKLNAPQYPAGLYVTAFIDRMEGDVAEIDGLNHYIGMRPLAEAAVLEQSISVFGIVRSRCSSWPLHLYTANGRRCWCCRRCWCQSSF
jgi:copper chaperone NosL